MRGILMVQPPPENFAAYAAAVRDRIVAAIPQLLDLERLIVALHRAECVGTGLAMHEAGEDGSACGWAAPLIAAEYAALSRQAEKETA
jgi:hypothetical protein